MKDLRFRDDRVVEFFRDRYQQQADRAMAELALLHLVEHDELSAMAAAEILGLHLTEFVKIMAEHGVPYFRAPLQDPEESLRRWKEAREKSNRP